LCWPPHTDIIRLVAPVRYIQEIKVGKCEKVLRSLMTSMYSLNGDSQSCFRFITVRILGSSNADDFWNLAETLCRNRQIGNTATLQQKK
jgi:hypothetical protein